MWREAGGNSFEIVLLWRFLASKAVETVLEVLNPETLPMIIYAMAGQGVSPEVDALSVIITVGLGALILLAGHFERASDRASKP